MSELQRPIQIGGRWYVLATSAPAEEQPHALKRDELFALFDRYGDIVPWEGGDQGIYLQDTRYLSHLELLLEGVRPLHLNTAARDDGSVLAVGLMNPDLTRDGQVVVPKGRVHLLRQKLLWDSACHEELQLTNHGLQPLQLRLELKLAADYADLFEVRGMQRAAPCRRPMWTAHSWASITSGSTRAGAARWCASIRRRMSSSRAARASRSTSHPASRPRCVGRSIASAKARS